MAAKLTGAGGGGFVIAFSNKENSDLFVDLMKENVISSKKEFSF